MEIDELKELWNNYNRKIEASLNVNKELLLKLNLEGAKKEMRVTKNYEASGILISVFALLIIFKWTIQFSSDTRYLVAGIIACLSVVLMLALSIKKYQLLTKLEFLKSSVEALPQQIAEFENKYLRFKKIEMINFPFYVIAAFPVAAKGFNKMDLFENPKWFLFIVVLGLILGYAMMLWIYKGAYEKRLKNSRRLLAELDERE